MRLPTITIGTKTYFIDRRLNELRNVENPHDAIRPRTHIELEIIIATAVALS